MWRPQNVSTKSSCRRSGPSAPVVGFQPPPPVLLVRPPPVCTGEASLTTRSEGPVGEPVEPSCTDHWMLNEPPPVMLSQMIGILVCGLCKVALALKVWQKCVATALLVLSGAPSVGGDGGVFEAV